MFKNYLLVTFRNLLKNKVFALINIVGMGIALAVCIVAFFNHMFNYEFDRFNENFDEIYRITSFRDMKGREQEYGIVPATLGLEIKKDIPGIDRSARMATTGSPVKEGLDVFPAEISYVDPEFLDIFTFPLVLGEKKSIENHFMKLSLLFFALLLSSAGWAQRSINGTVSDESGQPLPGVSVVVKGTATGVATNMDGKFSLNVPANAKTLVFSFIGMKPQEEQINDRSTIDVRLIAETIGLEEVVAIGYGTQKKVTITGAVSSVGSDELVQSPNASVGNSLAGRVTGLSSIQYSGQPGADAPEIYIRGIGSLTTDRSSPLMLVDGVERSFTQLDPDEIESISVLKDAASASIYGAKAAFGVILIITKASTRKSNRRLLGNLQVLKRHTLSSRFRKS